MKYLSVNNHSKYTQVMWSPGKQNFCGLKEYKKKHFQIGDLILIIALTMYKSCETQENTY